MSNPLLQIGQVFEERYYNPETILLANSYHAPGRLARTGGAVQAIMPVRQANPIIRQIYGKPGTVTPRIGDHPDFVYLKDTDQYEMFPITTLFMDIESSTRLTLLYNLREVQRLKNALICTTIDIIQAFDGHVHRIMGDAVMAYFGGKKVSARQGAVDGLNAAATIQLFATKHVLPFLREKGFDHDFGIRLGLDYGDEEKVLWSSYGYPGSSEVTATGFNVDVASKLQHSAGRNQVMIGDSLRGLLDFPEDLLTIKTVQCGNETNREPYLLPNITDDDGNPVSYRQYLVQGLRYLACSPFAYTEARQMLPVTGLTPPFSVEATVHDRRDDPTSGRPYVPTGSVLPKGQQIRFKVRLLQPVRAPWSVRFKVENHGSEAKAAGQRSGRADCDNHQTDYGPFQSLQEVVTHWESTAYQGLHYMILEVTAANGNVYRNAYGVFIE